MEAGCNNIKPQGVLLNGYTRELGKVMITPVGAHDSTKEYEVLSLTYDANTRVSYISKKLVPVGTSLSDRDYWQPMNTNGAGSQTQEELEDLIRPIITDVITDGGYATGSEIDNKIAEALEEVQGALTFDSTPIAGSDNPVKSSGIYIALQGKQDTISDLNDIRTHASEFSNSPAAGITSTNINSWNQAAEGGGTITGITMNGSSKGTSGVVDLGTVVTQEADPTVPQWAKAANKPAYTAQEVGALPADTQFKTINNESILGNTDISIPTDVYSKNESDSRYLKNTDATSTYATKTYVSDAIANVVYIGDDAGSASSSGEGEGGSEVTPSGDYVTSTQLTAAIAPKANDSEVVHLTGTETITGNKTLENNVITLQATTTTTDETTGEETTTITDITTMSPTAFEHTGGADWTWLRTRNSSTGTYRSLNQYLNTKANDVGVVHNYMNESIDGIKTFNDKVVINSAEICAPGGGTITVENIQGETVLASDSQGFYWLVTDYYNGSGTSLQEELNSKVNISSNRLLPTVTTTNNGKILKVVNGVWALSDDATGAGGGSTVHVDNNMQGYPTIADLYVSTIEDLNWGDSDSWDSSTDTVMSKGAIERTLYSLNQSLVNTINALADRVSILESKLASLYSFDSTNSTLTINDPNSSNS